MMSMAPVHRQYAFICIADGKKLWCCKRNSYNQLKKKNTDSIVQMLNINKVLNIMPSFRI